jgi:hypothetical protein
MNKEEIITPEVGMGAFTGFNGDRYPYTIVDVVSPKKILRFWSLLTLIKSKKRIGDSKKDPLTVNSQPIGISLLPF